MASIVNRPNGHKWVQFKNHGKRQTLRLGKVSVAAAREAKHHVEVIVSTSITGEPTPLGTARWLREASPTLRDRLASCSLVSRSFRPANLGELLKRCLEEYAGKKPNTIRNMTRSADLLLERFGSTCSIESITAGDADDFRRWLRRKELAETTVSELCRKAKRFFSMAVDHRWIDVNPFGKMRGWTRTNTARQFLVDRATTELVMRHCEPDWQTIVALVRYGGLRCPSEVLKLRWEYIDWEGSRFTVHSPKTEHLAGRAYRSVPLFPELRPVLALARERAADGAEYVVSQGRGKTDKVLYSAFRKRVIRAGITPWPKLFVNLRSSRETELVEQFPIHVVTAWLGNSPTIAQAHYLQVTDDHYRLATVDTSDVALAVS
jgi:integrase